MKNKSLMLVLAVMLLVTLSCSLVDVADKLATENQPAVVEAQPVQDTVAEELQAAGEASISQDGVTLYYDPDLILGVEASSVAAQSGDEMYQVARPSFPQFNLVMDNGAVSVVSVEALKASSETAAATLQELQTLLSTRTQQDESCIPEVTLFEFYQECGHQEINAGVQFLSFQNGTGVRFVTVYGIQDVVPISNEHLVYVFQGLTEDGKYYVKAGFHIYHALLEDELQDLPQEIYADETGAALQDYFAREEAFLEQNPDEFQPALEHLDALLKSLRIE